MATNIPTMELTFKRTIPAAAAELFDGWLSPKVYGTPWNMAEKFSLDAKIDGLFYWHLKGVSHYGRFTEIERPSRIQHTWVSPNTLGMESIVTVTFKKEGVNTLMTLIHSELPDTAEGQNHQQGWTYILEAFAHHVGNRQHDKTSQLKSQKQR